MQGRCLGEMAVDQKKRFSLPLHHSPKPVTDPVFLIRSQMPRVFIVVCSELWDCRSLQGLEPKLSLRV